MGHVFKGLIFIMLDFSIDLGAIRIGFLPDFLGYIFLIRGFEELEGEFETFSKAIPISKGMVVFSTVLYAMDLFGVSVEHPFLAWVLGIICVIARLTVLYRIVQGVREMEMRRLWDLQGDKLRSLWLAMAVLSGIVQLVSWIPLVGIAAAIAGFVVCICFLVAFHGTKRLYEEQHI